MLVMKFIEFRDCKFTEMRSYGNQAHRLEKNDRPAGDQILVRILAFENDKRRNNARYTAVVICIPLSSDFSWNSIFITILFHLRFVFAEEFPFHFPNHS